MIFLEKLLSNALLIAGFITVIGMLRAIATNASLGTVIVLYVMAAVYITVGGALGDNGTQE